MKYRPEIDGLRAISVMTVVFFHFDFYWMSGGFIGVDVFFVISGYLITSILIGTRDSETITFRDFYLNRIKRLAPALILLLVLCFAAGYLILSPGDYRVLAESALYTLVAGSNFYFLYHTGYFDPSALSMPLLHTWSLAVEEQFYLLWPLILFLLRKPFSDRCPILWVVLFLAIVSFVLNLHAVSTQEASGFYLAHNRAWELLAGAALALAPSFRLPKALLELLNGLGLAAILYAACTLTRHEPYPGFRGLIPVLGAAAFIASSGRLTFMHRMLATRIPVLIGRASYSIYLYHWPILVFWRHYTSFAPMTIWEKIVLILLSCAAGLVSWKFVEQPFDALQSQNLELPRSSLPPASQLPAYLVRSSCPEDCRHGFPIVCAL